jgi:hypothetical protein
MRISTPCIPRTIVSTKSKSPCCDAIQMTNTLAPAQKCLPSFPMTRASKRPSSASSSAVNSMSKMS